MSNIYYYPVLKWKKGEQNALKTLGLTASKITPVFQLTYDDDDEIPSAEEFFNTVKKCYSGPFYIDTMLSDDSRELLKEYIIYAFKKRIPAMPFLYPDDIDVFLHFIKTYVKHFAVNIPIPYEFQDKSLSELLNSLKPLRNESEIDLFFNADLVSEKRIAVWASTAYKEIFQKHSSQLAVFNKFIICLTSFPKELNVVAGGIATYERYDIKIFKELLNVLPEELKLHLAYSDYGVTKFTETKLEPYMYPKILPKVKYTTYDKYVVYKGEKNIKTHQMIKSYKHIAKELVRSSYYNSFGKDFSNGDLQIYDKATYQNSGVGNNTQWVQYCANHHITVLVAQLSNFFGA